MSNYNNKDLNNLKNLRNLTPSERASIANQLNQIDRERERQREFESSSIAGWGTIIFLVVMGVITFFDLFPL